MQKLMFVKIALTRFWTNYLIFSLPFESRSSFLHSLPDAMECGMGKQVLKKP